METFWIEQSTFDNILVYNYSFIVISAIKMGPVNLAWHVQ